jgi:hydroxyacylglutathione hydrolase
MATRILPIELGFDTCYVLRADGLLVIDAGQPRKGGAFRDAMSRAGLDPSNAQAVLLTHAHWDHMGSAAEIQASTGAPLWVHEAEAEWVRSGAPPLPPGVTPWGRTFMSLHRLLMPLITVPPANVDRELGSEPLRLDDLGIPGVVMHTPGHSPGSVSVILDSGEAFVGDLAMNRMPLCRAPSLPIFADDVEQVRTSWQRVLERPVRTIYPAHGRPFPVETMRKLLGE